MTRKAPPPPPRMPTPPPIVINEMEERDRLRHRKAWAAVGHIPNEPQRQTVKHTYAGIAEHEGKGTQYRPAAMTGARSNGEVLCVLIVGAVGVCIVGRLAWLALLWGIGA